MELDDLSQSGIRRIADYSPYLDQLAGLAQEMGLRQRSNLVQLERCLHEHWSLGQNNILSWAPLDEGILILVLPHYAIAEFTSSLPGSNPPRISPAFITELISGDRHLNFEQMQKVARLLEVKPVYVPLRQPLSGHPIETQIIEKMIRRYGISYVASRAVTLFDIVGFSLLTPFEQMTQLNSLSYSLNSAYSKLAGCGVEINFARTTTGDGYYVWNRDTHPRADHPDDRTPRRRNHRGDSPRRSGHQNNDNGRPGHRGTVQHRRNGRSGRHLLSGRP